MVTVLIRMSYDSIQYSFSGVIGAALGIWNSESRGLLCGVYFDETGLYCPDYGNGVFLPRIHADNTDVETATATATVFLCHGRHGCPERADRVEGKARKCYGHGDNGDNGHDFLTTTERIELKDGFI